MVVDSGGASGRTDSSQMTRPAFKVSAGIFQPRQKTAVGGAGGLGHPLLDPSTVGFWRLVIAGAAFAYIVGFHITLGRTRLGLGPGR